MLRLSSFIAGLALLVLPATQAPAAQSDAQQTVGIVTMSGSIDQTNRNPITEATPSVFARHGIIFDNGYEFSHNALAGFPQTTYVEDHPRLGGSYSGPLLSDLLKEIGATGDTLTLTGLDGHKVETTLANVEKYQPILAIELNGEPLTIGEMGPTRLVYPPTGDAEMDSALRKQGAWALYHIGIKG